MGGVTTGDALNYLKAVKDKFEDSEKYDTFLEVLNDCKHQGYSLLSFHYVSLLTAGNILIFCGDSCWM